jgi:predicted permease
MTSLWQDIRYSLRLLAQSPGFTSLAVLTLVLGIGANTTIFSWINATLLDPIPGVERTNELVDVSVGKPPEAPFLLMYPDFEHLRENTGTLSGLAGYSLINSMNLTGTGKPERIWGALATANYFNVLGVKPILGRTFLPEEDKTPGAAPVAVISYRFWQMHFGGNSEVIGQEVRINEHRFTIIGVTPMEFHGSQTGIRSDLWIPISMTQQLIPGGDALHNHNLYWLLSIGRLKPGVQIEQAQQELTSLLKPIVEQYPEEHKGHESALLSPLWRGPFGANQFLSTLLPLLMAVSGTVLLLTCANVANLLLVRSVARRREIAIRLSMGASRWRLVRQLLVESLMLSVGGGLIAMLVTLWTSGSLMLFVPAMSMPVDLGAHTDRKVLLATLGISILTAAIFGVLPALRTAGIQPASVLKEDSRTAAGGVRKARLTSAIVVAQIALSLLLLIGAGLFVRSFVSAQQYKPGFNPDHVLLATYDLFPAGYNETSGIQFHRRLLDRLRIMPGVKSVTIASRVPTGMPAGSISVKPEGYAPQAHESMEVPQVIVGPDYLGTMQIPLAAGREITAEDNETSQPVAMVNQSFAKRYWPNQNPLGKHVVTDVSTRSFVVVGVTKNSSVVNRDPDPGPVIYLPVYQLYHWDMTIHMRVAGDPLAFTSALDNAVHEMNPDLPLFDVMTLQSTQQFAVMGTRIAGTLVGIFGLLAMALAAVGVYGVIAYITRQRTHELAIRLAFGAERRLLFRLVLRQGLYLALIGISVGLALSLLLTRFLSSLLVGVTPTDFMTFTSVSALLCAVSLLACFVPAWRATQVDPMVALRHE